MTETVPRPSFVTLPEGLDGIPEGQKGSINTALLTLRAEQAKADAMKRQPVAAPEAAEASEPVKEPAPAKKKK